MTLDELFTECWSGLPPFRKRLAGQAAARRALVDTLQEFDAASIGACQSADDYDTYKTALAARVRKRAQVGGGYGFAIAAVILFAIISAVVQWLVMWWLDHVTKREALQELQRSLAA